MISELKAYLAIFDPINDHHYFFLTLLWNLSQQLDYPLNYLPQITPPGTSKLFYC